MDPCVGSFVADVPFECAVWPKTVANVGPNARVRCDLPRNRLSFLGVYDEQHQADVSVLLN
jgi:hypothetical protein